MTRLVFKWSSLALALASTNAAAHQPPNYDILEDLPTSPRSTSRPGLLPDKAADERVAHWDTQRQLPTFIWADKGGPRTPGRVGLQALKAMTPEQAAREQLSGYVSLYGKKSLAEAGANLSALSRDKQGVTILSFEQQVDGVEVFRQGLKVLLDANNELVALTGNLSPHVSARTSASRVAGLRHQWTAPQAVAAAYRDLTGGALDGSLLERLNVRAEDKSPYTHYRLASYARPLTDGLVIPARARPVYFPMPDGLVPAYYVELNTAAEGATGSDYYAYVVSATDGRLLLRNNLTVDAAVSYRVWAETAPPYTPLDGPAGGVLTPHPTGVPATISPPPYLTPSLVTLQNAPFSRNDPWLPDGATETLGNNVDAYADLVAPDGYNTGDYRASVTAPGVFDRTIDFSLAPNANTDQVQAATTQLFYMNNWLHDWFYDVGFDEASRNAQEDNFGRGGLGHDRIHAQAQDHSGRSNANMSTPADGASPRMQMYLFDGSIQHLDVLQPASAARRYSAGYAEFGPQSYSETAPVVLAVSGTPANNTACTAVTNASEVAGKIALIDRTTQCGIGTQIINAQAAGARGVIMVNSADNILRVTGSLPQVTIPSQYVALSTGNALKAALASGLEARMWREVRPDLDGTIDNAIVAHEWGHYLSNRLIWNGSGLTNNQGRAMGEGWADFTALLMMTRAEDINVPTNADWNGTYVVAEYATRGGSPADSTFYGIRRVTYSSNTAKNALTFKHIDNAQALPTTAPILPSGLNAQVHNSGEIWATLLWECYTSLLRAHPFNEAQQRMKQYLVNGYKLTPATPTYLEARDAIIAAASAADPEDGRRFWAAFAKRGAGVGAVAPVRTSTTHNGVVESYDLTADVAVVSIAVDAVTRTCDRDGILDNGETGQLRITLRNLGPNRTEQTVATVTSPSQGVTLGNGGRIEVPALDALAETSVTLPVSLQGVTGRQTLTFTVTTSQGELRRAGDRVGSLSVLANYDEAPASTNKEDVQSTTLPWTRTHDARLDKVDWVVSSLAAAPANRLFYGKNQNGPSDMRLTTPALPVSTTEPLVLKFKQAWDFESYTDPATGVTTYYDGAVIELSEDGGQTWVDVGTPLYTQTLATATNNLNPLDGRRAIAGRSAAFPAFIDSTLDLGTAYAGKTVRLRFRIGSDINTGTTGWLVDDLEFTGITSTPFTTTLDEDNVCVAPPAPIVSAGADVTVPERTNQSLQGSASDPEDNALTYAWTQLSGPAVTLTGANTLNPSFVAPEVTATTAVVFQLSASNGGSSATDTVTVTVTNVNRAPTVNAGVAGVVDERESYTLMGSASDADGDALTYAWTQVSGPSVELTNASALQATFVAPEVTADETLTFVLSVSDGQTTVEASVDVVVRQVNRAPVANAGEAISIESGAPASLNGASSTDPDGDALGYTWTQVEGPAVTLTGADTATPSFTAPAVDAATTLRFSLVVNDGDLNSEAATVTVTVTPKPTRPDPQPEPQPEPNEPSRCGCSGTGAGAPAGLLGLALFALARRRRQVN